MQKFEDFLIWMQIRFCDALKSSQMTTVNFVELVAFHIWQIWQIYNYISLLLIWSLCFDSVDSIVLFDCKELLPSLFGFFEKSQIQNPIFHRNLKTLVR